MKKIKTFLGIILGLIIKGLYSIYSLLASIVRFVHKRKLLYIPIYTFFAFILYITFLVQISGDGSFDTSLSNRRINDITELNAIQVHKIIKPESIQEIANAVTSTTGPISIGGGKFSMGGQTAFENSLHIDMRSFNKIIDLDTLNKEITIQPGITWRNIQDAIDPYDLSIKIMQTYANFTVGGSISVNCHGRYIGHGPIISSVKEIKIITADGQLITASRSKNQNIFNAAIGGYGGIGVIVETTLYLADNVKVERQANAIPVTEYNAFFNENIKDNEEVIFQNGDLYPPHYDQILNISWHETNKALSEPERLRPIDETYWLERKAVSIVSWGDFGKWIRRKVVDPLIYRSEKVVWRNNEASYNVRELEPKSREKHTYVLQEYFIPVNNIQTFIPKMRDIYNKYNVNVINVSLRHAKPDKESYLAWAQEEVFAFVIYYKQATNDKAKEEVKVWTQEMTNAILSEGGTWYLPYQPHATLSQFNSAYPDAVKYFAIKDSLDSEHRFTNKLLDKYNPYVVDTLGKARSEIDGYLKAEEQTILTVPEWYLVFNPKEYADYLASGENPSAFPYYRSIDEYWKLYDRSLMLVSEAYPENAEYKTMLQVIGISVTMEYGVKMIYENSIGWFFSLFAEEAISPEEKMIIKAHKAYSDFIYHTAWYEFEFLSWVSMVWQVDGENDGSFLRKWERKLFFTTEFLFKAFYAQLIEWAAQASYEPPNTRIYLEATTQDQVKEDDNLEIIAQQDSTYLLSITRWGAFTTKIMGLSESDIIINNISGNDEIVVSIINRKESAPSTIGSLLYKSEVVTNSNKIRLVYLMPVKQLMDFIHLSQADGAIIEHIYDY